MNQLTNEPTSLTFFEDYFSTILEVWKMEFIFTNIISNTMNLYKNTKLQNRNKYIIWLAGLVIIVVIGFLNKTWFYNNYDYLFKSAHFNIGDAVFIKEDLLNDPEINAVGLYREIRPLTAQEIDTILFISDSDRNSLKSKLKNSKSYLTDAHISIMKESLLKFKTRKVGNYLKRDILNFKGLDKNGEEVVTPINFYALKLDEKVSYTEPLPYVNPLPKYYTWANKTLYIHPFDTANSDH
jgi:hypothetical protein